MQHVGSSTDPFRYRWNNYRDSNRKAETVIENMQAYLFENLSSHGHNILFRKILQELSLIRVMVQITLEEKNIGQGY